MKGYKRVDHTNPLTYAQAESLCALGSRIYCCNSRLGTTAVVATIEGLAILYGNGHHRLYIWHDPPLPDS